MTQRVLFASAALAALASAPFAAAGESRSADAHEHGVSALQIAIDGDTVEMRLEAPGADIVGFEFEPETEAQEAAVDAAEDTLLDPLALFVTGGDCVVTAADADYSLLDDDHDHDHGHSHDHDHGHSHDDHAEEEHAEEEHAEFEASYTLTCAGAPTFSAAGYFEAFESAQEVEAVVIAGGGQGAFEATREAPGIDAAALIN